MQKYPEDNNRNEKEIDAIAGLLAIEHTSIDTITNQRLDSSRFMKAIGDLEDELKTEFPYYLRLVIPYDAIKKGQNWKKIKNTMRNWLLEKTPGLQYGREYNRIDIKELPFIFWIKKDKNRHHGLFICRNVPEDKSLSKRIKKLLDRKVDKLLKYNSDGYTTILLIESDDIALMNENILIASICESYHGKLPDNVDQIWYADTTIKDKLLFIDLTETITNDCAMYINNKEFC
ncbi:MAG: hypothetical protein U5R06_10680 [candidate division KSB1 bacterium]|nr:hypothetical protein [candidate division KSB1 bacterium]